MVLSWFGGRFGYGLPNAPLGLGFAVGLELTARAITKGCSSSINVATADEVFARTV